MISSLTAKLILKILEPNKSNLTFSSSLTLSVPAAPVTRSTHWRKKTRRTLSINAAGHLVVKATVPPPLSMTTVTMTTQGLTATPLPLASATLRRRGSEVRWTWRRLLKGEQLRPLPSKSMPMLEVKARRILLFLTRWEKRNRTLFHLFHPCLRVYVIGLLLDHRRKVWYLKEVSVLSVFYLFGGYRAEPLNFGKLDLRVESRE